MTDSYTDPRYPSSDLTSKIIAAAIAVHRGLGPGFEEVIYQRTLEMELRAAGPVTATQTWRRSHSTKPRTPPISSQNG